MRDTVGRDNPVSSHTSLIVMRRRSRNALSSSSWLNRILIMTQRVAAHDLNESQRCDFDVLMIPKYHDTFESQNFHIEA